MKKAIYDEESIKKVNAKCTDLYPKINQCIMIARSLDIPNDFEYATRIREIPGKLEKEAKKIDDIKKWIEVAMKNISGAANESVAGYKNVDTMHVSKLQERIK